MAIYVSGSVGYTLLEHNNIYRLILSDVHGGVTYCIQDSTMISSFLNDLSSDNSVLLEEVITGKFNLEELFSGSPHTQELKRLSNTNNKIKSVDIRPLLLPFSWELVNSNNNLANFTLIKYISLINSFFNLESELYNNYIIDNIKNMHNNKIKHTISPCTHFNELQRLFIEFKNNNSNMMESTILYIYNNDINILHRINNICSMIMEWYIILLIYNNIKNSILHVGLAHSNRIIDLLTLVYGFKLIKQGGINKMTEVENINTPSSCILIPSDITKKYKYNKKFGFNF
jgi:hypothetical protein